MTVSGSAIKIEARNILKNNYSTAFVTTVTVLAVWYIFNYLCSILEIFTTAVLADILLVVLCVVLFAPLLLGYLRHLWRMSSGVTDNPIAIFYYFSYPKLYFKCLSLIISLSLRIGLCYLIFLLPYFVLQVITGTWIYETLDITVPLWTLSFSNIITVLHYVATVATVFSCLKYYLAPIIFVADEKIDTAEAIHMSKVISKKTMLDFIFLCFSILGWAVLSILVLPLIYTLPYMFLAYLKHCSYAVEDFNNDISKINYDDIPTFVAGA